MNSIIYDLPILLVDDDAMVRDIMVEYLKAIGMNNMTQASSGKEALRYLNDPKFKVELVITDWEMPEVNGLTLMRAIRKHPQWNNLKIVIVTSQSSAERFKITQASQLAVSAYIVKPFRADVLKEKIWEVMGWSISTDNSNKEKLSGQVN